MVDRSAGTALSKDPEPRLPTNALEILHHCRDSRTHRPTRMERPFRTTHLFEKRGDSGLRVPSERPSVILAGRWAGHDLEANLRPSYVLCLDLSSPVLVLCWQASDFRERIIPVDDLRFTFGVLISSSGSLSRLPALKTPRLTHCPAYTMWCIGSKRKSTPPSTRVTRTFSRGKGLGR